MIAGSNDLTHHDAIAESAFRRLKDTDYLSVLNHELKVAGFNVTSIKCWILSFMNFFALVKPYY